MDFFFFFFSFLFFLFSAGLMKLDASGSNFSWGGGCGKKGGPSTGKAGSCLAEL